MIRRKLGAVALAASLVCAAGMAAAQSVSRLLPTEWTLVAPNGPVGEAGTFAQSATLSADGRHVIVVSGGAGPPGVRIFDSRTLAAERDVALKGAYGAPLPDARGAGFWVGTGGGGTLEHIDGRGNDERSIALGSGMWPAAIARSPDGNTLAVSADLAGAVLFIDERAGTVSAPIAVGKHPAGVVFSRDGRTLFVANWGERSVSAVDVATHAVSAIPVGNHPEALALGADGAHLYVAETDDDTVGIIDVATRTRTGGVNAGFYDGKLFGASPNALALSPKGDRLYVTCGAANAIAVLRVDGATLALAGAIPTGWYPSAVALERSGQTLFVADAKGEGSRSNPQYEPFVYPRKPPGSGYVADTLAGSVRRIAIPDDATLADGIAIVRGNAGPFLKASLADPDTIVHGPPSDADGRAVARFGGPIRHVIYIIKENRTYDQVLGDLPGANGDPQLTLFAANVTPNQHALARRFGIFDNTFADAQVSADGHNWSTAAFGNDYLERMWPQVYGERRKLYDFEDGADAATPHSGYLWNAAARGGVSLRNYGEFTTQKAEGPQAGASPEPGASPAPAAVTSQMADLAPRTDPLFVGFDLSVSDEKREAEWQREFDAYEKSGTLPALEIMRLPNDHTAGTRPSALTPTAYVAQNDLAVGRVVDAVSHAPDWKSTAIFILEDDAQNGPDHVDAQRMTFYLISPYARGGVEHERYSTAGVVRTIEILLGLAPMSVYDAAARPLYAAFTSTPNFAPYDALPERVRLDARNGMAAYRARDSARLDFAHEDAVPDAELNDIVWHAVRGARATPPPYGAFAR